MFSSSQREKKSYTGTLSSRVVGMWGTVAENTSLLLLYILTMIIIVVLQLAGGIVCFVELKKIEVSASYRMQN